MLNSHSKVGIVQIIAYIPASAAALYLLLHRHGRPRMAWGLLSLFSLIRVAGGVIVILLEDHPSNVGLTVASYCLLGVGVMPLIVATIGLVRIVLATDLVDKRILHYIVYLTRALFAIGAALLIAGGIYLGNYKSSNSELKGAKLVKAGYIVVAVILAILIAFQAYLWRHRKGLSMKSLTILKGTAVAVPFLIVRITYAFLSIFNSNIARWNVLTGSVGAFIGMVLVMEYIVVGIYISVGLVISPVKLDRRGQGSERFDSARRVGRKWIDSI